MREGDIQRGLAGKKILVLSVPAGAGHTRVAEAIRTCAAEEYGDARVVHLDAMAFGTPCLRKVYTDFYLCLVKRAPGLWRHVYRLTDQARPDGWFNRLRRWIEGRDCRPLLAQIATLKPDVVVCTHFQPAELLSRQIAAGALHCPVWVQVTDFDLHRMWVHPHMAGYFAGNDEVAFRMREQGIPAGAIHVAGIPTMPAFSRRHDRAECARALGLDPSLTTFLLMGGGAGLGDLSRVAQRLLAIPGDFQLIVLAGKNLAELSALHVLAERFPGRLAPQGYTDQVERLMACADLVVTKPGGSTLAECLAMGLPMILHAPIPGQEEHNANFLLEQGAALKASDLPTLDYRIRYLMARPAKLKEMAGRARTLGRPHAARQVLETVLVRSGQESEEAYA
ncbi:glycosyltransferase [Massilia sp. BSC265]|uniref:MGDG synthase family glycosyltransferase n=1 Tax=Massilia sp. BSC265 TaxID=1549812 RepID=UPI0004E8B3FB|nr:glycosyltransferase [Massilia sp. BSC265]KFI07887.1 galactosyldiacylglycerol synthase [Massilia sp. BSC265]